MTRPHISIVDDDESVRESLPDLLSELGYDVQAFCAAEDFLLSSELATTDCVILDIAMPGMTGPELQSELTRLRRRIPLVFITAQIDESVRQGVLRRGAVACLFKPFTEAALIEALARALCTQ